MLSSEARRCLVACLVLIALPTVLFWQVWWPNPQQRRVFAYGDFAELHYPMRSFVVSELRQGQLPLWDPYTLAGEPAAADTVLGVFYPLSWWQAAFPALPFWALEVEAIAHLGLAGIFTFLLVRRLTGRAGAGLIAGIAFGVGGFLTSYPMLQLEILETAVWLPAGLWLLERALPERSLVKAALAGAVLGLGIVAGHPQTFLYAAYAVAAYLLFRARRLRLGWRFTLAAAVTVGGAALGIGAVQWLPSLELLRLTPRIHWTYEMLSRGFALSELAGLVRPNPGQWSPLYVGLIPLALALASVALDRRAEVWFWAAVTAIALVMSLGGNGPLYPLAYRIAPGFALFRQQERIAFLVSLSLAVLAGYGYAGLARWRCWPAAALPIVAALVFLDLFHANSGVILQVPPPGGFYAPTPALQRLQQISDPIARVSSESLLPADGNAGLLFGIRDVTGNAPLHLASYDAFIQVVPEIRWFQMLNVRYLLTRRKMDQDAFKLLVDTGDQKLYDQSALGGRPLWIAHALRVVPNNAAAISATADMGLDVFETAVLERQPSPLPQPAAGPEGAQITAFEGRRVVVDATLSTPGILVLSEVDYPGWVARVDGKPWPSLRAYGVLRAVALPAGRWQVEWRYEPLSLGVGATFSLLTPLCMVAFWLRKRRAWREPPSHAAALLQTEAA